jgi:hypothetical protein
MPRPVKPDFQEPRWDVDLNAALDDISDRADGDAPTTVFTGSTTLIASQSGAVIEMNLGTANTVTVPANVFQAGQVVEVCQVGAGLTTIAAGTGLTLRCQGKTAPVALAGQWAGARIRFRSPTEAVLEGNVA